MKHTLLVLGALLCGCRLGPAPISTEALESHIAYLAGDALEGRDSGTTGGRKAEEYVTGQLRALGLAVETQEFSFVAASRRGPDSSIEIGGKGLPSAEIDPYPYSQPGVASGPAVFAGYGVQASDLGHDDYRGLDVKGKVVVVLDGLPDAEGPHGKLSAHQSPRAKALKAHELGAAALLILQERLPAFVGDDVTQHVGIPVMVAVAAGAAGLLGLPKAPDFLAVERPRALEKSVTLRADVSFDKRTASNVLAWLPARGPNAVPELVIIGAHHDGLGRGTASSMRRERHGEVHNGADDNASGVAGVIELARRLRPRAKELRRSILFITFAGEERGLLGSRWFAEHPRLSMPGARGGETLRPVAMVNMDMIGRLKDHHLIVSGAATAEEWPKLLAAAETRLKAAGGPAFSTSVDRSEDVFGSSDHVSFYHMKVPVLFFFTGAHPEYHTPDDDLFRQGPDGRREQLINLEGARDVLSLVEEVLVELATAAEAPRVKAGIQLEPAMRGFKAVLRLMPDYGAQVEGMKVAGVTADGPAAKAGLRTGDVIVRFGTTPVRSVRDYMVGLEKALAGQEIEVEYLRDGASHTTRVVPIFPGK